MVGCDSKGGGLLELNNANKGKFLALVHPMKTYRFLASFRLTLTGESATVHHESSAKVQGSFRDFLAEQLHDRNKRKAFLADLTGHRDPEPVSLSIELQGYFIPVY